MDLIPRNIDRRRGVQHSFGFASYTSISIAGLGIRRTGEKSVMKSISSSIRTLALATGLAIGSSILLTSPVLAQKPDPALKINKKVGAPLNEALEAVKAKNFDLAAAKVKEAEAVEKKTPYEEFKIRETAAFMYVSQQKYPEVAAIYEKQMETPEWLPPELSANLEKSVAQLYYNGKNYEKSTEFSKRWLKNHPDDTDILALLSQSYYVSKDFPNCRDTANTAVAAAEKAGQQPKELWMQLAQTCAVQLDDQATVTAAYEKLVRYYPKPDYWDRLLTRVTRGERNDRVMFQVLRVMADVGTLKNADQYMEYAQLALDNALPGEALRAVEKGYEQKVLGTDAKEKERHDRLMTKAKQTAQSDKASLPALEKEAQSPKATGGVEAGLGLAYFNYEQYDKAIAALEGGLKKGGLKNPEDYKIALGISQLRSGKKDEARETFKSIPKDSQMARVADMWVLRTYN
jgi:tetratricopeptide (TPR) repeat protein